MAGLTKQHFNKFAELFNKYVKISKSENEPFRYMRFIEDLALYLETQNPLFNRNQFLKECLK